MNSVQKDNNPVPIGLGVSLYLWLTLTSNKEGITQSAIYLYRERSQIYLQHFENKITCNLDSKFCKYISYFWWLRFSIC